MTRSKNIQIFLCLDDEKQTQTNFFLFRNDVKQKQTNLFVFSNDEKQKQTNLLLFRNDEKQKQKNFFLIRNEEKQKQSEKVGGSAALETEEAGAVLTTAEESTKVRFSSLLVQFGPQRVFYAQRFTLEIRVVKDICWNFRTVGDRKTIHVSKSRPF